MHCKLCAGVAVLVVVVVDIVVMVVVAVVEVGVIIVSCPAVASIVCEVVVCPDARTKCWPESGTSVRVHVPPQPPIGTSR